MNAPAKLNLGLFLGPTRRDGLHEICSVFHPLALADRLVIGDAEGDADEVVCPGVEEPNLASAALAELRRAGWRRPPLRIEIDKRIPVAAGLGGGSADAAAVLRLAAGEVDGLAEIAARIGADVPSQLAPRPVLVRGAGELVEPLPATGEWAAVLIPDERGLATARVFAEADRLGLGRSAEELASLETRIRQAAGSGSPPPSWGDLLCNDLEPAAVALLPEIRLALDALLEAGAARAFISGSGPTAVGLFADIARADEAASGLPPRFSSAIVTSPDPRR